MAISVAFSQSPYFTDITVLLYMAHLYIACVVLGNPCFNENYKVPCNTMHSVLFMFAPAMSQRGNKRGMARYLARCDALTIEV